MIMLGWIGAPLVLTLLAAAWMTWARWSRRRAAAAGSMRANRRLRMALAEAPA